MDNQIGNRIIGSHIASASLKASAERAPNFPMFAHRQKAVFLNFNKFNS